MTSAEEIKEKGTGPSIQELSVVDVAIGKVSILALSGDESLLAACVGNKIHFYPVSALLYKVCLFAFKLQLYMEHMGFFTMFFKCKFEYLFLTASNLAY